MKHIKTKKIHNDIITLSGKYGGPYKVTTSNPSKGFMCISFKDRKTAVEYFNNKK